MINWKEQLPEWFAEGIEPEESKKIQGWVPSERPPANVVNWLLNRTHRSLEELRDVVEEIESGGDSGSVTVGDAWKFVYNKSLNTLDLVSLLPDENGFINQCKFRFHRNGDLEIRGQIVEGAVILYPIVNQFICDTTKVY
jgi:hypothetical protein